MDDARLCSIQEAADLLGVHHQTVRKWIKAGHLRAGRVTPQSVWRIRRCDIEALIQGDDDQEVGA